jgi:HemY protein
MLKLLWRLALLIVIGLVFAWLAERPGAVSVTWMGRVIETSVMAAIAALAAVLAVLYVVWRFLGRLWRSPRTAREYWRFRKHKKAYESLSRGLIAASAGDTQAATRHAATAGNTLSDEPLVNVLAAQAAQLRGDRTSVKRVFEEMAKQPETEVLGLRGLFSEAKMAGDLGAAIQHAEKALARNPRLAWASAATLQVQSARKDWSAAAMTIAAQAKSGLLARADADRKRAALLAADALNAEDNDRDRALTLAAEAHHLDPGLVPAALVAARCHIANGSTRKAVRILRDTWSKTPHPDIAAVLAQTRSGDGPEERFERVRDLVGNTDEHLEGAVALARAAVAAKRWNVARKMLEPHCQASPQARICALMAQIEEAGDDKGRAREWLARALNAPRDPMWVSDGVASPHWTPLSPVTGEIVPCEWKMPFETPLLPEYETFVTAPQLAVSAPATGGAAVLSAPRPPDDPGLPDDT